MPFLRGVLRIWHVRTLLCIKRGFCNNATLDGAFNGIPFLPEDVEALQQMGVPLKSLQKVLEAHPQGPHLRIPELAAKLEVLQRLGVDRKNLALLLDRCPSVLRHDLNEMLRPLIQGLEHVGVGKQLVGRMLTSNPRSVLRMCKASLESRAEKFGDLIQFLLHHCPAKSDIEVILSRAPLLVVFGSKSKAQRVVEFLKRLKIDDAGVSKIIRKYPAILTRSYDKGLRLRVEFLKSLGMEAQDLSKIILAHPHIMSHSFELQFKPAVAFLQNAGLTGEALVKALSRAPHILGMSVHKSLPQRLEFFTSLGFDPKSDKFARAMCITASLSLKNLEAKYAQLVKFGLSKSDVCKIVISLPQVLQQSEGNIRRKVEFLVKHMKHPVTTLPKLPMFLLLSLEQRIKPRIEFVSFLYSKEITAKVYSWTTVVSLSEARFKKTFVDAYPEVASRYRSAKALSATSDFADSVSVC